jgi:hypothetical protein
VNWRRPDRTDLGFLGTIGDCIAGAEARHPGLIPNLRREKDLVVASDYGGENRSAPWSTYCFILASQNHVARWAAETRPLRRKLLPDGRRMAFKRLGDRARARALSPFLASADDLPGLLACFAVQRKTASLFTPGRLRPSRLSYEPLRTYPAHIAEKVLRLTHILALLIAGLSAADQDVLWITDEDPIAATPRHLQTLTEVLGRASAAVVPHQMRHLRVATARGDSGDRSVEDLLAIPDLVAGMLADFLARMMAQHAVPPSGMFLARPERLPLKLRALGDWFSDNSQYLRRLVVTPTGSLRATHLRFLGSRDVDAGIGA